MEHQPKSNESLEISQGDLEKLAKLKHAEREKTPEATENKAEQLEAARETIKQPETQAKQPEVAKEPVIISNYEKLRAYRHTMASLHHRLKPSSRKFSRFIHSPSVEKASEVMGATVMRPSVSLGAAMTAMIVGGFFYFTARSYGFRLSGSEFILSLLAGGLIGFGVELIAKPLKRRHKS